MSEKIKIAVDAMGGENSPNKILEGIKIALQNNQELSFFLYGQKNIIDKEISKSKSIIKNCEIIDTKDVILDDESPLSAAKRGKDTSMWKSIESQINNKCDISLSAGNTGALFVLAKMNLEMIENIDKPALSGLWPNKRGLNVVLDLGANVECNEKNLIDFSIMGSALHKALFPNEISKVALLNIG